MMQSVVSFAEWGGKVLGVCNGFQILCESRLLPGALLLNAGRQFICRNVYITGKGGEALKIPIAHGEGRYYAEESLLNELEQNGQILYRYCDVNGAITQEANPNGSLRNIAGICNKDGNVFGMMPHPERATSQILGNTDGRKIFNALLNLETAALLNDMK